MNKNMRSGFTLPEVLISTALAVMVFFTLGTLLSRSFSVWYNGMAQWKLAHHARVTRIRLLDGGFGRGTGLLSATNHTINSQGGWTRIDYYPLLANGALYQNYGWTSDSEESTDNIWLSNNDPSVPATWAYGQSVKYYDGAQDPDVKINSFDAEFVDANTLELTYMLRFSAAGRHFEQPQTIRAVLLNLK